MSISDRLKKKSVKSPFQLRPVSTDAPIDILTKIAKQIIAPHIEILKRQFETLANGIEAETKKVIFALQRMAEREIKDHIRSRSVEIRGADGKDGRDGTNGKDGARGEMGLQGVQGKPGKDGSPDTPDQIVGKINKSESLISFEKISGLSEWVNKVQQIVREKGGSGRGGGSGNRQHEHSSISSATTTVTTTYKIAGAGFDVDVYYNGQYMARGTDYTVGTDQKTITLLFTPADSTVLDVVYTRT